MRLSYRRDPGRQGGQRCNKLARDSNSLNLLLLESVFLSCPAFLLMEINPTVLHRGVFSCLCRTVNCDEL